MDLTSTMELYLNGSVEDIGIAIFFSKFLPLDSDQLKRLKVKVPLLQPQFLPL